MAAPFQPSATQTPIINQQTLVRMIRDRFENLTDVRTGKNSKYEMSDAALSAFAVFFLQNPSFLAQQINLQKNKGKNNLQTLFGAYQNPSDNQIRKLLDAVSPCELWPIFHKIFNDLYKTGWC